eukprot:ANDGO_02867.mRNA.1 putative E3 ubiquitin protein ligase C167.07c
MQKSFNFTGSHKSRPSVNLSGRSVETRDDILEKVRKERENREEAKRRAVAAATIQRYARGFVTRRRFRNVLAARVGEMLHPLCNIRTGSRTGSESAPHPTPEPALDPTRLLFYCKWSLVGQSMPSEMSDMLQRRLPDFAPLSEKLVVPVLSKAVLASKDALDWADVPHREALSREISGHVWNDRLLNPRLLQVFPSLKYDIFENVARSADDLDYGLDLIRRYVGWNDTSVQWFDKSLSVCRTVQYSVEVCLDIAREMLIPVSKTTISAVGSMFEKCSSNEFQELEFSDVTHLDALTKTVRVEDCFFLLNLDPPRVRLIFFLLSHILRFYSDDDAVNSVSLSGLAKCVQLAVQFQQPFLVKLLFERNVRLKFINDAAIQAPRLPQSDPLYKFLVPFASRAAAFLSDMRQRRRNEVFGATMHLTVNRETALEDAFLQIRHRLPELGKAYLQGSFRGEAGLGQGVTKELLVQMLKQAFSQQYGLFTFFGNIYVPNPDSIVLLGVSDGVSLALQYFECIGALLGKCISEGIVVDAPIADFFLGKIVDYHARLDDLAQYDTLYYKNLKEILSIEDASVLDDLCLYFTVNESDVTNRVQELVSGGRDKKVDMSNRRIYVQLVADFLLNRRFASIANAFARGMNAVVPKELLGEFFRYEELSRLISGNDEGVDVADWMRHTIYQAVQPQDPEVVWFWTIVSEMSQAQRSKLLRFATSNPRVPLLGFGEMNPQFCISRGDGKNRLPTAATCFNLLRLPVYDSLETMRHSLLTAIEEAQTFEHS